MISHIQNEILKQKNLTGSAWAGGDAKTFKLNFLAVKYKKAAFQKTLTRFWTANNGKYENVIIGAINLELLKGKTKVGKQGTSSVIYLFIYLFKTTKYKD